MNTRLQVEHPVTEKVTGLDLVEQMIRVAADQRLGFGQSDVAMLGWAVEARVYAEDPYRGFLPSTGRLVRYRPPAERASKTGITVRNDTGVYEGGEISMFYDPMIAKLCTHAPGRTEAIDAMATALDQFRIEGINHNINFLTAIMHNAKFRSGKITTAFIAEEFPDGFHGMPMDETDHLRFVAAASAARLVRAMRARGISGTMNGTYKIGKDFVVSLDGRDFQVTGANLAAGNLHLTIDGKPYSAVTDWLPGQPIMYLTGSDGEHAIQITRCQGGYRLGQGGRTVTAVVRSPLGASLAALMPKKVAPDTSKMLLCPMPGLVVSINVKEGQEIKAGEALAVVEAMKMENVLTAQADGVVRKINAAKGDSLAVDEVIMEFA